MRGFLSTLMVISQALPSLSPFPAFWNSAPSMEGAASSPSLGPGLHRQTEQKCTPSVWTAKARASATRHYPPGEPEHFGSAASREESARRAANQAHAGSSPGPGTPRQTLGRPLAPPPGRAGRHFAAAAQQAWRSCASEATSRPGDSGLQPRAAAQT